MLDKRWRMGRRQLARPLLLLLPFLFLSLLLSQWRRSPAAAAPAVTSGVPTYGVNFITSAEDPADEQQYQNGLSTGAGWDRWPIYWYNVETSAGKFDWSTQDTAVLSDVAHGLQTDAILLGTPPFYTTASAGKLSLAPMRRGGFEMQRVQAAAPQGLDNSVFTDGTDVPGPGKQINPDNKWAQFVYTAVNRYKPGGVLAQTHGWPAGVGVTHWEMWNEPDLTIFWDSSLADYARLLKVGYLAAKHADPQAQVLFAGLANNFAHLSYYSDVLATFKSQDPQEAADNGYFHDIVATHNYSCAWRSWYHVWRAGGAMTSYGLDKPIWLNENGVPAWDDYPGPVWDPNSFLRATVDEQSHFVIQSALYATYAGADAIFQFQLYDGCGNQPAGTDFPPHNGELCNADGNLISNPSFPCAGDANGLFRNPTDATCFTQHPQPESARPSLAAYQVLTTYFRNVEPIWRSRPGSSDPYNGPQEWIAFYRADTGQRVLGLWTRVGNAETAVVTPTNSSGTALLVASDGVTQTVTAVNGTYAISLPGATNQNSTCSPDSSPYAIGGRPYLLIETDDMPPELTVSAPVTATDAVTVTWSVSEKGSGLAPIDITVSVDGGPDVPWLTGVSAASTAVYPGQAGHIYRFTLSAQDGAGNAAADTAVTMTFPVAPEAYLPLINR